MDPERHLLVLYVASFVCGTVSCGSLSVAWLYWDATLNSCLHINCGCVLFSVVTFSTFVGGAGWFCRFAVFAQLPVLLWATFASLFHAYRIYVPKKPPIRRRTVTFNEDGSRRTSVLKREAPKYWPFAVFSVVIALLLFSQAWTVSAGYFSTCREYRKSVSNQLQANGNMAQLVFDRLSCGTIYDFLDYLQPDPETLPDKYRRTYRIHTSYYLQVALISAWLDCVIWLTIASYNIYLAVHTSPKS